MRKYCRQNKTRYEWYKWFAYHSKYLRFSYALQTLIAVVCLFYSFQVQSQYIIATYDATGILLGLGCLFTWLSVLHYLAYDRVFSVSIEVLFPNYFWIGFVFDPGLALFAIYPIHLKINFGLNSTDNNKKKYLSLLYIIKS